jgi:hypothetical protein
LTLPVISCRCKREAFRIFHGETPGTAIAGFLPAFPRQGENRMKKFALALATLIVASLPNVASAECRCSCVNGEIEAVCTSASELPPVCAPRACNARPVRASLIAQKRQIGTIPKSECRETEVLNPRTGSYVVKQICP